MSEYNLCEPNQSAYKPNHSVETGLVCVKNDFLLAADNQYIVTMLLLDFDILDHSVMLYRLSHDDGVVETALHWFKSYLSERVKSVHLNGCTSPACPLPCGPLKVLYSVRSCSPFMQHHYRKSFETTT